MKKSNKKTLALSVVAFALILMSLVSFTYSWIDDIKLVEFTNDNLAQNGAPLKTGTDINAKVNITNENNTINLGNMLQTGDISFQYNNGTAQAYNEEQATAATAPTQHIKYDTESGETVKDPKWNDVGNQKGINSKKGYFYESGDMHLSPCYSDGDSFYFSRQGVSGYREGNKDDENVNYISFTTKVSSPDANIDFWFGDSSNTAAPPTVVDQNGDAITGARIAITIDGHCNVYSALGTAQYYNPTSGEIEAVSGVRKTTAYTYNHTDNNPSGTGKNGNTLFSIKKGGVVNMNVKIWLEGGTTGVSLSDININLVSSWAFSRKITIIDRTTTNSSASWIKNNNAKMFLTLPGILSELDSTPNDPDDWKNMTNAPFWPLTKVPVSGVDTYSATVPMIYNNEEMLLYRCTDQGWNYMQPSQEERDNGADDAEKRSDYKVYCWNWWKTNIPNTFKDENYTLYGSSFDTVVTNKFGGTPTNKGYGTWAGVDEISVYSAKDNSEDYATKADNANFFLRDFTDESTGENYAYVMYRADTGVNTPWKAYVPSTSSKIQFNYFYNDAKGTWGYRSWNEDNRQRRPLQSTGLYTSNSLVYHIRNNYGEDQGWGYWEGADMVYLFKDGDLASTDAYAYIYNSDSDKKADWPGEKLNQLKYASGSKQGQNVTWKNNIPVYYSGSVKVYKNIIFNDSTTAHKSGDLVLFPGCFYDYANPKWYGSLDDTGAVPSGGGGSGGDASGDDETDTMDGYTTATTFKFKVQNPSNNQETAYDVKSNSEGNKFKVDIYLYKGINWTTVLKGSTSYGNGKNGEKYAVGKAFNGVNLSTAHNNNFAFDASNAEAGNYIVTFTYGNSENDISIQSVKPKASS